MPPAPRISVAMATYKGGKYVAEQLASLARQTLPPAEIVITDDNSPDDTVAIIRQFAETSSIPVHLHRNPRNLGVIQNFAKAISLCTSPYIALADQDDVWLPTKLERTCNALRAQEAASPADTPILVHTGYTPVAAMLEPLAQPPHSPHATSLTWLILRNMVTGCTVLFNRALIRVALPFPPETLMHDHWLALVAKARGELIALPEPTILYRQHGGNQVGASARSPLIRRAVMSLRGKLRQYAALRRRLRSV